MASLFFNVAKKGLMDGSIDLDTDDIRVALVMLNTTTDTQPEVTTVSGFTTLDECDATGYARQAIGGKAVTQDNANNRGVFNGNQVVFSGLSGNATRNIQGALIYKHVGADSSNIPICFSEFTTPVPKEATSITVPWHANGILYLGG